MSTLVLGRTIAGHLGQFWTACPDEDSRQSEVHLHGPDDQLLHLFSGSQSYRTSDRGRLFITADFGSLAAHLPHNAQGQLQITVAESKPPATIAHDIRRRLLPGYQAAHSAARRAKQHSDAVDAAHHQLAATVATRLGAKPHRHDTTDVAFGTFDVGVYGSVKVRRGEHHSSFTVQVPRDQVAVFATLLNSFRHNTHP